MSLPPELLLHTIELMRLNPRFSQPRKLLTCFAFSLVCRKWYNAARPYLAQDFECLDLTLFRSRHLRWFLKFLKESQALGINYTSSVRGFRLSVAILFERHMMEYSRVSDIHNYETEKTLLYIIDLTNPLCESFHLYFPDDLTCDDRRQRYQNFFSKIKGSTDGVKHLDIHGLSDFSTTSPYGFDKLIRSFPHLEIIRVQRTVFGTPSGKEFLGALQHCEFITDVDFYNGSRFLAQDSSRIFSHWPRLRSFTAQTSDVHWVLESLAMNCPCVESIVLVDNYKNDEVEWGSQRYEESKIISDRVSSLLNLRRLTLRWAATIDDNFLPTIARLHGLRHIAFRNMQFSTLLFDSSAICWDELEYLDLRRTQTLSVKFVTAALKRCVRLKVLMLPNGDVARHSEVVAATMRMSKTVKSIVSEDGESIRYEGDWADLPSDEYLPWN